MVREKRAILLVARARGKLVEAGEDLIEVEQMEGVGKEDRWWIEKAIGIIEGVNVMVGRVVPEEDH